MGISTFPQNIHGSLTTSIQASNFEIIRMLLRNAKQSASDNISYYIEHPSDAPGDLWEWVKENKLTCALIVGGIVVIVVPLANGFGPAGPVLGTSLLPQKVLTSGVLTKKKIGSIAAGWQSGIGAVAAGSLFATLQSLAMTGVLTGIGAGLIGTGVLNFLRGSLRGAFESTEVVMALQRGVYGGRGGVIR